MTLRFYDTASAEVRDFVPLVPGKVSLYYCGATVQGMPHVGHIRSAIAFDQLTRWLQYRGFRVTVVRNVTDIDDKILAKSAESFAPDFEGEPGTVREEEWWALAYRYEQEFLKAYDTLGVSRPTYEPRATGHIPEMHALIQQLIDRGHAYPALDGSGDVYFDVRSWAKYGSLTRQNIEDMQGAADADPRGKKDARDFALWKGHKEGEPTTASWASPWGAGRPGWHLECSAMSTKYLGKTFDIHGGGNDLKFPHHENEVAQSVGACDCQPARYWLHTNMLLMNGRKMSKSDGNTISPVQLFSGDSPHVSKGYSPMVIRFFMLQSHYRSTLDLTDDALQAAEKGYRRLMEAYRTAQALTPAAGATAGALDAEINQLIDQAFEEMSDDFNTPKAMARLFELVTRINGLKDGHLSLKEVAAETLDRLKSTFDSFIFQILGLKDEMAAGDNGTNLVDGLMEIIIDLRKDARTNKDWGTSDKIRDALGALEVQLKDGKDGTTWVKS